MLIVFYQDQEYARHTSWQYISKVKGSFPDEVYNGSYVYNTAPRKFQVPWSRADGCPCLIADVPKVYRTLVLLMEV